MKKPTALILSILCILSSVLIPSFAADEVPAQEFPEGYVAEVPDCYYADEAWLGDRLGAIPDGVKIVCGENAGGLDMTTFEDDGYIIRTSGEETLIAAKAKAGLDRAVRRYAKLYENGRAGEIDEVYHEGYRIDRLTVFGHDISEYTIVIPSDATPRESFAADELQRLLAEACGATLPIVKGAATAKCFDIHDTSDPAITTEQGFRYYSDGERIVLEGHTAFGCATAVYHFLEDQLGWERLTYGTSMLRESDHIDLGECSVLKNTALKYMIFGQHFERAYESNHYLMAFDSERADPTAEQMMNARHNHRQYAGLVAHANHGMTKHVWGNYGYNEWYHVCYSDDSIRENITADVYSYIGDQLAAGKQIGLDLHYIDLSTGDNLNFCHCKKCNATMKEENNANAGPIVRFMNTVSEEIDADYPGLKYLQFAYHGSNVPPKTAPNDLVYFTFCLDGSCTNHPLDGSKCKDMSFDFGGVLGTDATFNNTDYAKWLRGWCELSDHITVWYYMFNAQQRIEYTHMIYDDFKFMYDLGVYGIYWNMTWSGPGTQVITAQMMNALNWNPDMTREEYDDLVNEYIEAEYGDGWSYVRDFINTMGRAQVIADHCWNNWDTKNPCETYYYDNAWYAEQYDRLAAGFDEAHRLTRCAREEMRLEMTSVDMDYKGCFNCYFEAYDNGDEERLAYLSDRYEKMYALFDRFGFAPYAYLTPTVEDIAWNTWVSVRNKLPKGEVQREAPAKYAE